MRSLSLPAILSALASSATALPQNPAAAASAPAATGPRPLPLLIWHGLGDRYDAEGLHAIGALAQALHPGTYVHYVRLGDDGSADRSASFLGNVSAQVAQVCAEILAEPRLRDPAHGGVRADALGFSQGGQFLRALVQRCGSSDGSGEGLSVRALVTFGSQHTGVARVKECGAWDLVCRGALALLRGNVWSAYVQARVVPAQYFRTRNESTGAAADEYLANSAFLADVNNEREEKNRAYGRRLAALEKFVMFLFEDDTTVIPKQSGWFAEVNMTSGDVTPLRETPLYTENWLGLRELDAKNGLVFKTHPGEHMSLDEKILNETFKEYFGSEREAKLGDAQSANGLAGVLQWPSRLWEVMASRWQAPMGSGVADLAKGFL